LGREIKKREELLSKLDRQYFEAGKQSDETYLRLKREYEKELIQYKARLNNLKKTDDGFTQYATYGFTLLGHLKEVYEKAELDAKRKLFSSIFPEKLVYARGEYRTKEPSEVFKLLCNPDKGLEGFSKKKVSNNANLSLMVARRGLLFSPPKII
jgi:hypothetical protein